MTTKLYWAQFGPMRRLIAVRKGGVLSYLHHDHLGTTKAISGATGGPMKYYPFGSTYQEIASPPTDNLYTGQKRDLSTGLYFYGARYYNATSGTFTQPDSIVPQPGNPQSFNRYAYGYNNPVKYSDPTGHDSLADWEKGYVERNGQAPTDEERQDFLYTLIYPGSGDNGTWTDDDRAYYKANRNALWGGQLQWPGAEKPCLQRFVHHGEKLASFYGPYETEQYVRAFALLFGGVPYGSQWAIAAFGSAFGPPLTPLPEGTEGWEPTLTEGSDDNPSHHYAGLLFLAYFAGGGMANIINAARDFNNPPDLLSGQIGALHGYQLSIQPGNHQSQHSLWMREALRVTPSKSSAGGGNW